MSDAGDLPARLRSLADCDARAGEPLGKLMREAATEIDDLYAAIARLEGYSEALRAKLTAVRRAAGCDHD